MPSSVDEQPPSRPSRSRPQPARRRPASRSKAAAPSRRAQAETEAEAPTPAAASRERRAERGRDRARSTAIPASGSPRPPRSQRKAVVVLTVISLLVVGLGVFTVVLSSRSSSKKSPAPASQNTPVPTTTFSDAQTGFTVQYPRSWQKIAVPVADYRLAVDGGSNVAFTIRVVPIDTVATAANLQNFMAVTDGLVGSNDTVSILKEQAVSLNGMLGYYYFYTFTDGGVSAVHAHYFLFSGNKMNILVFQALPDDFANVAPTFDMIAESFRSDPNVAVAAPTPTTTTVP